MALSLPLKFQASNEFTHFHQIKAFDGDDSLPLITLSARKGRVNKLQIIHIDSNGLATHLSDETSLSSLLGVWLEADEKITYGSEGKYSIVIKKVSDGAVVLSYNREKIDLWRKGTTIIRPKWGIYRSLKSREDLRDEEIRFGGICLTKELNGCTPQVFQK